MSNTDTELFELCKKVYKLTGWEAPETYKAEDGNPENDWQAYDTDYLLEKLPFEEHDLFLATNPGVGWWVDSFDNEINIPRSDADTPLKALLKLTIALSDVGELDNDQSS